ncbi:MAG: MarR family transcriptional regulator [Planctomycetes bacterium]|nr:MarR family transcriptional regulator [Planctomycetota bacterium]
MGKEHDWTTYRNAGHRAVVTVVRTAERLSKAADRFFRDYGLSLAQFNVLTILRGRSDGMAQTEIGDALVVSRANVTGLISRLKAQGLCDVRSIESDARIRNVVLTKQGRELVDTIQDAYFEEIRRVTRGLRAEDLQRVAELLDRLGERA